MTPTAPPSFPPTASQGRGIDAKASLRTPPITCTGPIVVDGTGGFNTSS